VFPSTALTWIDQHLDGGDAGRAEINRHLMDIYAVPLRRYLVRTPYRTLGDPADLVAGFFAERLARPRFLQEWRLSGKRLRYWLCNALVFFLKESAREGRRDARYRELAVDVPDESPSSGQALDREFALAVIRSALERTREHFEAKGSPQHFSMFHEHHADQRPYVELAAEHGVSPARAQVMARTGREVFRRALRDIVGRDCGRLEDVDAEIDVLLESLQ
jgi:hypothetical protein